MAALFARKVNNYHLYANHAWYVPGVAGMFGLLGWLLVGNLLGSLLSVILAFFVPQQIMMDYSMLVLYPLGFLPAMIYAAHKSQRNSLFEQGYKLDSGHFGPFKGWQIVLLTVALTFATMFSADLPNYLNYKLTVAIPGMERLYDLVKQMLDQLTGGPLWSSFLVAAIFAPIFEEWLCRGMVLRGLLARGKKPAWAIVLSALFFALIHLNPWQALNAFIIGLVMGYVYYKTGSLWLTMLIHFVNNGCSVVMSQFDSLSSMDFFKDMMPLGYYTVACLISLAVLVGCLLAFKKVPLEHPWGNIDPVELKVD